MKFNKMNAFGFVVGYFIVAFVLLFGPPNIYLLNSKLFWADIGLLFTIGWGYLSQLSKGGKKNGKKQRTLLRNQRRKSRKPR